MPQLSPQEVHSIGENYVKEALLTDNFSSVKTETKNNDFDYITADGVTINILLRTRAALYPGVCEEFSDQEKSKIISSAIVQGRIPYTAYVIIDEEGKLVGEISWYKLSSF